MSTARHHRTPRPSKHAAVWVALDELELYSARHIGADQLQGAVVRYITSTYAERTGRVVRGHTTPSGAVFVRVE